MATTISFKKKAGAPPAVSTTAIDVTATAVPSAPPAATAQQALAQAAPANAAPPPPAGVAKAAAAASTSQLTAPDHYKGVGGFEGEFDSGDMATPYLSLFGKTSKGFEDHPEWIGQWVYDKEIPLGSEIRVVFIRAVKRFIENLPFGSQQIPQRFNKMEHARQAGFNDSQLAEQADLDLLIEVDNSVEGVSDLAHITLGNKAYILCRYSVRSTAYGRTVGILAKDASGFLKGNLINGFYDMSTQSKTSPKGTYFVPSLKTAGQTPADLRSEIIERMGS